MIAGGGTDNIQKVKTGRGASPCLRNVPSQTIITASLELPVGQLHLIPLRSAGHLGALPFLFIDTALKCELRLHDTQRQSKLRHIR